MCRALVVPEPSLQCRPTFSTPVVQRVDGLDTVLCSPWTAPWGTDRRHSPARSPLTLIECRAASQGNEPAPAAVPLVAVAAGDLSLAPVLQRFPTDFIGRQWKFAAPDAMIPAWRAAGAGCAWRGLAPRRNPWASLDPSPVDTVTTTRPTGSVCPISRQRPREDYVSRRAAV